MTRTPPARSPRRAHKPKRGGSPLETKALLAVLVLGLCVASAIFIWIQRGRGAPRFDAQSAFRYLLAQCDFGPRAPGSEGHRRCLGYLLQELGRHAKRVDTHRFTYADRNDPGRIYEGANIIASFDPIPRQERRIMLCAHWDTRPWADRDPDPEKRRRPILGANDGASGVAVLLEMARIMHKRPPRMGVDIVLFDLEDIGDEGNSPNPFAIGSERFVQDHPWYRPSLGILVDMVGDRDLSIRMEGYSYVSARPVVEMIWEAAGRVGSKAFVTSLGGPVLDDHIAFLKRGIMVANLIDFDYPYWHTMEDAPDKCSPASLKQVGDVLVELVYGVHGLR